MLIRNNVARKCCYFFIQKVCEIKVVRNSETKFRSLFSCKIIVGLVSHCQNSVLKQNGLRCIRNFGGRNAVACAEPAEQFHLVFAVVQYVTHSGPRQSLLHCHFRHNGAQTATLSDAHLHRHQIGLCVGHKHANKFLM